MKHILAAFLMIGLFGTAEAEGLTITNLNMHGQETDRQYVDRLKQEYIVGKEVEKKYGSFAWANIYNPTKEESERHHRLVAIAEKELGLPAHHDTH